MSHTHKEGVIYPSGGGDLPTHNCSPRAPVGAKNYFSNLYVAKIWDQSSKSELKFMAVQVSLLPRAIIQAIFAQNQSPGPVWKA